MAICSLNIFSGYLIEPIKERLLIDHILIDSTSGKEGALADMLSAGVLLLDALNEQDHHLYFELRSSSVFHQ